MFVLGYKQYVNLLFLNLGIRVSRLITVFYFMIDTQINLSVTVYACHKVNISNKIIPVSFLFLIVNDVKPECIEEYVALV